jgi:hypothetical protein
VATQRVRETAGTLSGHEVTDNFVIFEFVRFFCFYRVSVFFIYPSSLFPILPLSFTSTITPSHVHNDK